MQGLMQQSPLTVDTILDHAKLWHGGREVVTRSIEGPIVRTTYAQIHERAKRLSNALLNLGIRPGDRVATLAWNTGRHIEAWYGVMGIGAVCHTLNPRLFPEQLTWIINHAEDRIIFTDLTFVPVLEEILAKCPSVEHVVVMTDAGHMPAFQVKPVPAMAFKRAYAFESLVEESSPDCAWGGFDENTAAGLCYTSGTTGDPKGVLYSHRSNFLHTLIGLQKDVFGIGASDVVLPIVPMFHANAWGLAFDCPAVGAKLVMPGAKMDGASVHELIETEGVTFSAAVPTVWQMLLQHLDATKGKITRMKRVVIGGSACPESIIRGFHDRYGVEVIHAWGMTEMSPLGTLGTPTAETAEMPFDQQLPYMLKQGRPPMGVQLRLLDDEGRELPHDGKTFGRLMVKGHAVVREYFKGAGGQILDSDGYFDTGDVATIDPAGFMQITDRAKDVIKSGGEWISSIDIENIAMGHPKAELAAVIGVPHPKWDERPLLLVKLKPGETATKEEFLQYLDGKIAKWWMPDDVLFVDDIPLGATGKIDKKILRQRHGDHVLPTIAAAGAAAATGAALAQRAAPDPVLRAPEPPPEPVAAPEPPPPIVEAAPPPEPEPEPPPVMTPPPEAPAMFVVAPSPKNPPAQAVAAQPEPAPEPPADPSPELVENPIPDPLADPDPAPTPESAPSGPEMAEPPSDKPSGPLIWSVSDKVDPKDVPPPLPSMPDLTPVGAAAATTLAGAAMGGKDSKGAPVRAPSTLASGDTPLSMPITPRRPARKKGGAASGYLTFCVLLSLVPALLVLGGALGVRFGLLDLQQGQTAMLSAGPTASLGWAQAAALVALLASVIGLFVAVFAGWSRLWGKAALALLICLATWGGFIGLKQLQKTSPPVHDVATEWSQPLTFSAKLMQLRGPAANPVDLDPVLPLGSQAFAGRRVADVNAETCGSARPVTLTETPARAFEAAKASLLQAGLELVTEDSAAGKLEATATGLLYGLKSDVVVQVSPSGQGSTVNMRSISRQGFADMGANCRRIGKLVEGLAG
ncbi:fatty-acyl-CoA synthase [Caulobacter ginsengisoli]|uniref:Fatty-acyl-CoA synthase n=1 Tax=Caulobacter ginsengisoli TaxID=400775 RepID=A0ABU0IN61_9CAUL|nr:long-chain-fatty-acid--CoA ligase [Caulobacter ginsengisoli]MDQ0463451.1 fatty-acyl-CoA synthase [Caulobacter ginsengisoli]